MRPTRRSTFDVAPIARIAMLARALMAVALGAAIGLPPVNGAARKEATAPPMKAATAVRLEGSLTLDGKLDEPAWEKAPLHTGFEMPLNTANRQPIPEELQTSFRVLYDEGAVYFGVRCNELRPEELVVRAARKHDAAMWSDDDIEIFLDPVGDRTEFYQFAINSEGTQVDIYCQESGNIHRAEWSSLWQAAVHRGSDFWSVEVALPFALFHNRPAKMWSDAWVFSLSRTRSVAPRYYSQFSPAQGYHDVRNFGTLEGIQVDKEAYNLYAESPQFRLEPAEGGYAVLASLMVENRGDRGFEGSLAMEILAEGAQGGRVPLKLKPGQKTRVEVPGGRVAEQGKWPVAFRAEGASGAGALAARFDTWLTYTPVRIKVTRPNYRNAIYATQQVDAIQGYLDLGIPLANVKGSTARVTLSSSLLPPRACEVKIESARVPFELSAADIPEGRHLLRAEILRPVSRGKGEEERFEVVAATELPFCKLPPAPAVEARIDDQGNLLIDGSPVFIRGWYGSTRYVVSAASFPQAQLPHSTNYLMGASEYEQMNMGVYSLRGITREIDEAKAKLDQPIDDELKARLRPIIASVRHRRNIIGYYISDEPECRGLSPVFLKSLYEFLAEEDPYRFCKIVSRAPVEYLDACDVICPHPYMNPQIAEDGGRVFGAPLRAIHNKITDACAANDGSKAVWCMPQTFSYGGLRGQHPDFKESRWFALTALACGAKGLVPFIFNGYWNHLPNRIAMDYIFEEVAFLAPAWLARDSATEVTADSPSVDVIAKHYKPEGAVRGHFFIVAANQSLDPSQVSFSVPLMGKQKCSRVLVLRENRVIPVRDGKFTDELEGLGARIYTTLEVLPDFRFLDEIEDEIATAIERPALAGNILAEGAVKWTIGEFGGAFSCDSDLADAVSSAAGWIPVYSDRSQCVIRFEKPVVFSRVEFCSPTIAGADLDIWQDNTWKTIHQWKDEYGRRLEYKGKRVKTDRIRIRPTAARQGFGSSALYEITELGLYR
ncbi:MAG TPA: hypothetical protein GX715_05345 [Armatimonadetes bacterium]|jgi:hypothetical protein|nr:hypothetical protein [Armatimonadota bacterium]